MNILLDTQVAIWSLATPERLRDESRRLISDPANDIAVSSISVFEIAVKYRLAKRPGRPPFSGAYALRAFRDAGFRVIDLSAEHAVATESLPDMHADPFDRLLLAQALHEPRRFLTADSLIWRLHPTVIQA